MRVLCMYVVAAAAVVAVVAIWRRRSRGRQRCDRRLLSFELEREGFGEDLAQLLLVLRRDAGGRSCRWATTNVALFQAHDNER